MKKNRTQITEFTVVFNSAHISQDQLQSSSLSESVLISRCSRTGWMRMKLQVILKMMHGRAPEMRLEHVRSSLLDSPYLLQCVAQHTHTHTGHNTHTHTHTSEHTDTHTHTGHNTHTHWSQHTHTHTHTLVRTHRHTHTHTGRNTQTHTHTLVTTHTHTHTGHNTHTHTHTGHNTHTHTHTHRVKDPFSVEAK